MVIPNFGKKLENVLLALDEIDILLKLFTGNYLKANPEKYVMLSTNDKLSLNLRTYLYQINSRREKLLGIKIDCEL